MESPPYRRQVLIPNVQKRPVVAGPRKKKKHICAECGETFNHGIGLRKHQRQTGHKGSKIEEGGGAAAAAPAAPPPAAVPDAPAAAPPPAAPAAPPPVPAAEPAAPPPAAPAPAPVAPPAPAPAPAAPAPVAPAPLPDQPAAVAPAPAPIAPPPGDETVPVQRPGYAAPAGYDQAGPSKMEHTKHKLNLVSKGLKVVLSARAKNAGQQIKESARSGADIFTEALKLAVALVCFLLIPTIIFFWWKSHNPQPGYDPNRPKNFRFDDGALAARSTLLRYLDHVGKQQWDDAYDLLSPSWQTQLSEAAFRDAFLDINDVRWAVSDQRLNPQGQADVLVRLAFREGGKSRSFVGRFRLQQSSQGWRIDRAELSAEGR